MATLRESLNASCIGADRVLLLRLPAARVCASGLALTRAPPTCSFSFNIALAGFGGWLCIAVYLVVRELRQMVARAGKEHTPQHSPRSYDMDTRAAVPPCLRCGSSTS